MDKLTIEPGPLTVGFRGNAVVQVTDHMVAALERMRAALIVVAQAGGTITYGQLAAATGGAYPPVGFGKALDILSIDCKNRREPSLAALVVRGDDGEVGDAFVGDAAATRQDCYRWWGG